MEKFFFREETNRSGGEVVLISRHFAGNVELEKVQERSIVLSVAHEDLNFKLVNCYAPNTPTERIAYFKHLQNSIANYVQGNLLIFGDFNCVLDNNLDIVSGQPHKNSEVTEFNNMVKNLELRDIWRGLHESEKQFTWHRVNPFIARRLDYCLISEQLISKCVDCEHYTVPCSDHKAVVLELNFENFVRGPGYWKFNNNYLRDKEFIRTMNNMLDEYISDNDESTHIKKWEFCKVAIRNFCTEHGKSQAIKRRNSESQLEVEIDEIQNLLTNDPLNTDYQEKLTSLKQKLELQQLDRARGAQVRSRIKWIEEGEKNTKYFYNLEKARGNRKIITRLTKESGEVITDQQKLLEEQVSYYKALYSQATEADNVIEETDSFIQNDQLPQLEDTDAQLCEDSITLEETTEALKKLRNGSAPGSDGITIEFLKFFWNKLGKIVTNSFIESFNEGGLSGTQKRGIITLIHKGKELERDKLSNWRPITLTNSDYKILAKALAERLSSVIDKLISSDQVGYIKGRQISTIIRSIDDVINYVNKTKKAGYLLAIDYAKAFDSVSKTFLSHVFSKFGFGPNFQKWVSILNDNCHSSINHGGWISEPFTTFCGIKQGCPFSPLAFVLAVELLAIKIRNSAIQGIKIPQSDLSNSASIKIKQFADDTTLFLHDQADMRKSLEILKIFQRFSGLKLNNDKTKALRIGTQKKEPNLPFETVEKIKILGIYFENGKLAHQIEDNWKDKFDKMNKLIKNWSKRDLSIQGKVIVIKTFLISQFVYVMQSIGLPERVLQKINTILYKFLWQKKYSNRRAFEKVKRKVMENNLESGGLNMINMIEFQKHLHLQWIGKLANARKEENWWQIPKWHMNKVAQGDKIFLVNSRSKDLKQIDLINNEFWENALCTYFNNKTILGQTEVSNDSFHSQLLFNNQCIKYKSQVLFFKDWQQKGVEQIKDIINSKENRLLSLQEMQEKIGKNRAASVILEYNLVCNAIPKLWLEWISKGEKGTVEDICQATRFNNKPRYIKNILAAQKDHVSPRSQEFWWRKLKVDLDKETWTRAANTTKETRLRVLQWKIMHNIYPTNILLNKMKVKDTDNCSYCKDKKDYIEHFFCSCPVTADFWKQIEQKILIDTNIQINLSTTNILFGIKQSVSGKEAYIYINLLILIGKMCISILKKTESKVPLKIIFEKEVSIRKINFPKSIKPP